VPEISPWNKALELLSRREHSVYELKQKLKIKINDLQIDELDEVIEKLKNQNLLSDQRFALAVIKQKSSQGYGPKFIELYLKNKFVSSNDYDIYEQNINWIEICVNQIAKKIRSSSVSLKEKEKISRFLSNRGFNYEIIKSAFNELT
jgi:regulatory protein